ncbi:MAG: ABC transporter permease [Brevinema sp.]
MISSLSRILKPMVLVAIVLVVWFVVTSLGLVNQYLLPPPQKVAQTFWTLFLSGRIFQHIFASLIRVFLGFGVALVVASLFTLLFYFFDNLRIYTSGLLDILRHIPPLAVLSLLVLWFGIGELPKVGIVFMAAFFPLLLSMESGIVHCDRKLIEVGIIGGFSPLKILLRIALPSSIPEIIIGMNIGLSYAWRSLIGAELVAASSGIGYMILDARELSRPDIVMVGIICLGVVGALIDMVFKWITSKAFWRLP